MDLGDGAGRKSKAERRQDVNVMNRSEHEDYPFFQTNEGNLLSIVNENRCLRKNRQTSRNGAAMTNGQISSDGIEVFISYSHKDELLREELEKHLTILKRQKPIFTWFDRKIGAGEEWKGQIYEHLDSTQN